MIPADRRKIEELYQAARDPAKRAEVLAAADPVLRAEVTSLLAQDSRTEILGEPVAAGVAGLGWPAFCSDWNQTRHSNRTLQD